MSSLLCKCDEIIDLSRIPSPNRYWFLNDNEYMNILNAIDEKQKIFSYDDAIMVVKCPSCGRIWIFNKSYEENPRSYLVFEE